MEDDSTINYTTLEPVRDLRWIACWVPGQNIMADILQMPFGLRWRGVAAMASLAPEETTGSYELHTLCSLPRIAKHKITS